jgi:hypothetical protein
MQDSDCTDRTERTAPPSTDNFPLLPLPEEWTDVLNR